MIQQGRTVLAVSANGLFVYFPLTIISLFFLPHSERRADIG